MRGDKGHRLPGKDYAHGALSISCVSSVLMLVVAIISWFMYGEAPLELYRYVMIGHSACFVSYCGKQAYEYKKACETQTYE